MQRTPVIPVKEMVLTPPMATTMQNVVGQLVLSSRKTYTIDAKHFAFWLAGQKISCTKLVRDELVAYRAHLAETYAPSDRCADVGRDQAVVDEAIQRGPLPKNPVEGIHGFKAGDNESPHRA